MNREKCGFCTFSSRQNNNNNNNNNNNKNKGKFFHLQKNVLARERTNQPIPTQLTPRRRE